MNPVCILTDSTAQFTKPLFPGNDLVRVAPLKVSLNLPVEPAENGNQWKVSSLPVSAREGLEPRLIPPSTEEFIDLFLHLGQIYSDIVAIFLSSSLNQTVANARQASEAVRGQINVQVIDSQTTSIGLGVLVETAAGAAASGASVAEIECLVRGAIPHIYTVFSIPGLTYLQQAGLLDPGQALVGEMLGLYPLYTMEEGRLTPLEKVRNLRHLQDYFQEFVDEFDDLIHIAFIQSAPPLGHEAHALREHAGDCFSDTPFSEHPISLWLATLLGPRTVGVFAIEKPEE